MLTLHPSTVGSPDWELVEPGEATKTWDQWYDVRTNPKRWVTVPWFTSDRFLARFDSPNYRRPVSWRAKVAATLAATPKWFKYRLLRIKQR